MDILILLEMLALRMTLKYHTFKYQFLPSFDELKITAFFTKKKGRRDKPQEFLPRADIRQ